MTKTFSCFILKATLFSELNSLYEMFYSFQSQVNHFGIFAKSQVPNTGMALCADSLFWSTGLFLIPMRVPMWGFLTLVLLAFGAGSFFVVETVPALYSSIPGLNSLDPGCTTPPAVTTKNVSRHCPIYPWVQNCLWARTTGLCLYQYHPVLIMVAL